MDERIEEIQSMNSKLLDSLFDEDSFDEDNETE